MEGDATFMHKISAKLLALLLITAMLCSMFPVYAHGAQPEAAPQEISKKAEALIEADIWDKIDSFEKDNIIETKNNPITAADYAELSDEIEALVKQSDTYVEGTINRNGDFFTWETTEGIVCGYSPELRYKTRNLSEIGCDEIEVENYATKAAPGDKDVFLIAPYYGYDSSFTDQYKNEASSIAKATGGQYTLYQGTNATISNIASAMQNGGVVIFDSHGITDYSSGDDYVSRANSSYLCLKTSTGITSSDMSAVSGTYGTYYHAFNGGSSTYCVDGTAIKNHMSKSAPGTILWMAICLGMATSGLCTPMRNAGCEVVYGYSQSVSFTGDYKYETYFWNKMKAGSDVKTAISYMKSQSGSNWDPAYSSYSLSQAQKNYVAFPIVVSDQDTYPGQGKVDAVQTVKSTYKLIDSSGSGNTTEPTTQPTTAPSDEESYTFNLITSASNLTAGDYIILAAANGSYAGNYSYYALTTTQDSSYSTMQGSGLSFSSLPSALTCGESSLDAFVFTLTGSTSGLTLKSSKGSLNGGSDSNGVYLYYNTATTWSATYNSSSKGFQLKTGSVYMALRDDLSTMGSNNAPMFATSSSAGTTVMHMYKKEGSGTTTCSHSNTSTSTTPATCTTAGEKVVTCKDCGIVVSTTVIPATGHNISYTSNGDGTHALYCSNCNGTGTGECTYNSSNICTYCGHNNSSGSTDTETDRYELVTSASSLTSGEYLILATASGTYAGSYSHYVMTTAKSSGYKAMESQGLSFSSLPTALTLDVASASDYVWILSGNANGFTAKTSAGTYLNSVASSTALNLGSSATTWAAAYNSSSKGFALSSNSRYAALRDDLETVGDNGTCLFTTVPSTSYNVYLHLYKKVGESTVCTHSNTSTATTPATCTTAGEKVVTCKDCGLTLSTTAIPATGHTAKTTTTPATCTEAGKTVESCTTCGTTIKTTTIPATGHPSKTTTTAATCTTAGKTVESCTTCGATIKTTTIPATGHSTTTTTTPATCIVDGKTVETCVTCNAVVKTTAIPATGHTVVTTTTPATCTAPGKTVDTCTTCGATVSTATIPATGHTVKTTTVAPTCTASGKTTESCAVCGETIRVLTTAALGHDYTYTSNNNGTHTARCSRCARTESGNCVLTDNTCSSCGYVAKPEPEAMNVKINHTLNLASDISVNYAVATTQLAGYENFYIECKVPTYKNGEQVGTTTMILEPVLNGNYYYFTMDGLTAVQIGDSTESVLHAFKDGKEYVSEPDVYSVATYAYNQLAKGNASQSLKTLCAELLRYGAKVQLYKGYRTDSLADAAMTAEQTALLADLDSVTFGQNNETLDDLVAPAVTWAGKSLILDTKVTLRMVADLSEYAGKAEDLAVRVTYTNLEGNVVTVTVTDATVYNASKNYYAFDFSGLRAAELRTVLSAAVYAGDVRVSPTMEYSMDSYGNGRNGTLLTLCQALVAYADSARDYFAK